MQPSSSPTHPVGRFAPTPSGALHLGSLVAAVSSYLNVKTRQGRWLLRIDDLDPPRVDQQSIPLIQHQLEAHGLYWDQLIFQSQRTDVYQHALAQLQQQALAYPCSCSRQQILQRSQQVGLYDNYCRNRTIDRNQQHSWRLVTPNQAWQWQDQWQGSQHYDWQQETGDFIIKRADRVWAYHLACALDDADFGITEVIRGVDLLASTAAQQYLQHCLNLRTPSYAHHALIYDTQQQIKLSKSSRATALADHEAVSNIWQVLTFLQQQPPDELQKASLTDIWQWAFANWQPQSVQ